MKNKTSKCTKTLSGKHVFVINGLDIPYAPDPVRIVRLDKPVCKHCGIIDDTGKQKVDPEGWTYI